MWRAGGQGTGEGRKRVEGYKQVRREGTRVGKGSSVWRWWFHQSSLINWCFKWGGLRVVVVLELQSGEVSMTKVRGKRHLHRCL
jgi:hypothetical protein